MEGISNEAVKLDEYLNGSSDLVVNPSSKFQRYHKKLCLVKNGIVVREKNMKCIIIREYDERKDKLLNNKFVHVTQCPDGDTCSCDGYKNRNKCDHLLLYKMVKGGNPTMIPIQVMCNVLFLLDI
eukprot:529731_1